jgi:FlaA1/EpsC-like NDP-sugar epimerase
MGAPVRIVDLVSRFLAVTGATGREVVFTGLRPGEKLHEALFDAGDVSECTPHPRISSVRQGAARARAIAGRLIEERALLTRLPPGALRARMMQLLAPDAWRDVADEIDEPRVVA